MLAHSQPAPFPKLSPSEYLRWEERQREKYKYLDGRLYAMGGGSKNHSIISVHLSNLSTKDKKGFKPRPSGGF
ncbi:Uma2 family endonuclease [Synechocystis sp. CS-94]|nr:hypothetical protein D082_01370 [Synechocystis sp. PCC 6714]MCT0254672.1 Uma2 family endonuclease [Synechocystis sp. CS-94]